MSVFTKKAQIDELIQLLQKYELSIAVLYETFASILPLSEISKKAWIAYAKEERLHAKWINELHTQLEKENISFEQTKFSAQSTKTAIGYAENQIDKVIKGKQDLIQALNIAINIEKSLLESAFLRVFKLNGPKEQKIQDRLEEATKLHVDRLIEWRTKVQKA